MGDAVDLPSYEDLKQRRDAPAGSSWGLLGGLGTIARIGRAHVRRAAGLVTDGTVVNLDWPVNAFDPPTSATRMPAVHHLFQKRPTHRDDYMDSFYLQGTTQIDGLRHQAHDVHGFYDGVPSESIIEDGGPIGIDAWAEHGIVGRGVLLDVDRYLRASRGHGLDHAAAEAFPCSLLDEVADFEGVTLEAGDIVMVRTGWTRYYFDDLDAAARIALPRYLHCSGIVQAEESIAWLWDSGAALIAADNIAVEVVPPAGPDEFRQLSADGRMHPVLIAMLGVALGELWRLDELAELSAADGRYECMVVASPLNLRGGAGSPANAVAIR